MVSNWQMEKQRYSVMGWRMVSSWLMEKQKGFLIPMQKDCSWQTDLCWENNLRLGLLKG